MEIGDELFHKDYGLVVYNGQSYWEPNKASIIVGYISEKSVSLEELSYKYHRKVHDKPKMPKVVFKTNDYVFNKLTGDVYKVNSYKWTGRTLKCVVNKHYTALYTNIGDLIYNESDLILVPEKWHKMLSTNKVYVVNNNTIERELFKNFIIFDNEILGIKFQSGNKALIDKVYTEIPTNF
jgi:hypothetical protein